MLLLTEVRCVKGHFYDVDASTLCPHCGSQEAKEEMATTDMEDSTVSDSGKKRFSIFGKGKAEKEIKSSVVTEPAPSGNSSVSKEPVQSVKKSVSNSDNEEHKTRSFWSFEEDDTDVAEAVPDESTGYSAATSESRPHRDIDSVKTSCKYYRVSQMEINL